LRQGQGQGLTSLETEQAYSTLAVAYLGLAQSRVRFCGGQKHPGVQGQINMTLTLT